MKAERWSNSGIWTTRESPPSSPRARRRPMGGPGAGIGHAPSSNSRGRGAHMDYRTPTPVPGPTTITFKNLWNQQESKPQQVDINKDVVASIMSHLSDGDLPYPIDLVSQAFQSSSGNAVLDFNLPNPSAVLTRQVAPRPGETISHAAIPNITVVVPSSNSEINNFMQHFQPSGCLYHLCSKVRKITIQIPENSDIDIKLLYFPNLAFLEVTTCPDHQGKLSLGFLPKLQYISILAPEDSKASTSLNIQLLNPPISNPKWNIVPSDQNISVNVTPPPSLFAVLLQFRGLLPHKFFNQVCLQSLTERPFSAILVTLVIPFVLTVATVYLFTFISFALQYAHLALTLLQYPFFSDLPSCSSSAGLTFDTSRSRFATTLELSHACAHEVTQLASYRITNAYTPNTAWLPITQLTVPQEGSIYTPNLAARLQSLFPEAQLQGTQHLIRTSSLTSSYPLDDQDLSFILDASSLAQLHSEPISLQRFNVKNIEWTPSCILTPELAIFLHLKFPNGQLIISDDSARSPYETPAKATEDTGLPIGPSDYRFIPLYDEMFGPTCTDHPRAPKPQSGVSVKGYRTNLNASDPAPLYITAECINALMKLNSSQVFPSVEHIHGDILQFKPFFVNLIKRHFPNAKVSFGLIKTQCFTVSEFEQKTGLTVHESSKVGNEFSFAKPLYNYLVNSNCDSTKLLATLDRPPALKLTDECFGAALHSSKPHPTVRDLHWHLKKDLDKGLAQEIKKLFPNAILHIADDHARSPYVSAKQLTAATGLQVLPADYEFYIPVFEESIHKDCKGNAKIGVLGLTEDCLFSGIGDRGKTFPAVKELIWLINRSLDDELARFIKRLFPNAVLRINDDHARSPYISAEQLTEHTGLQIHPANYEFNSPRFDESINVFCRGDEKIGKLVLTDHCLTPIARDSKSFPAVKKLVWQLDRYLNDDLIQLIQRLFPNAVLSIEDPHACSHDYSTAKALTAATGLAITPPNYRFKE